MEMYITLMNQNIQFYIFNVTILLLIYRETQTTPFKL